MVKYDGDLLNYCCEHKRPCKCDNSLVIFEIDKQLFHELKTQNIEHQQYEIAIFLNYIDFVQKLTNEQVNQLSKASVVQRYT